MLVTRPRVALKLNTFNEPKVKAVKKPVTKKTMVKKKKTVAKKQVVQKKKAEVKKKKKR